MAEEHQLTWVMRINERVSGPMAKIAERTGGAASRVQQLNAGLTRTEGLMGGLKKVAMTAFAAFSIGHVAADIVRLGADIESTRVTFATFLGDANQANKTIAELIQFSQVTPFTEPEVIKAGRVLLAANIQAADLKQRLKEVGDVASGAQVPLEEMAAIYGKAMNKGRIQAEEMNQLAERGVPILNTFAKMFGVTNEEVMKLGEKGLITSGHMQEAFRIMTSEGGMFFNMMEKQSKTLAGRWSTLLGQLEVIGMELGEHLLPVLKGFVEVVITGVGWLKLIGEEMGVLLKVASSLVAGWAAMNAVLLINNARLKLQAFWLAATRGATILETVALWAKYAALQAVNAASGNLIALAAGVVVAAGAMYFALSDGAEDATDAVNGIANANQQVTQQLDKQLRIQKEIQRLYIAGNKEAAEKLQLEGAMAKLMAAGDPLRSKVDELAEKTVSSKFANDRQKEDIQKGILDSLHQFEDMAFHLDAFADKLGGMRDVEKTFLIEREAFDKFGFSPEQIRDTIDRLRLMDEEVVTKGERDKLEKEKKDSLNELKASEGKIQHITQNLTVNQKFDLDHETLEQRFEEVKQETLRVVVDAGRDAMIIAGKTG